MLNLRLDLIHRIFPAGILLAVGNDDEHHFFGPVFIGGVSLGITDFVNRPADSIKECCRASYKILLPGYWTDRPDVDAVVEL